MNKFAGRHAGDRCFVIGSGPSIARMDLAWLRDEITVCVNQSFKALDFEPTYICIGDRELWPRIKDVYAKMSSTVICSTGTNGTVGSDYAGDNLGLVVPMDKTHPVHAGHFRHDLVLVHTGYNVVPEIVLPFVLHCGFAECCLIGCDCTDDGYFYPQAESARPDWPQKVMPQTMGAYPVIRRYAEQHGLTRIVNGTYGGRLEAFDRVLFDSLRPGSPPAPLVVGYWTGHPKYRELAENMAATVRDFGLEVEIHERPHAGKPNLPSHMNWVLNCAQCPSFILDMMKAHPGRDLIYLDADAEMRRRPAFYLDSPRDYDFAAGYLTNAFVKHELQSNSLYFAATADARGLVTAWRDEQARRNARMLAREFKHPFHEAWDQWVLQNVLDDFRVPGFVREELPATYIKIMPTPRGVEITPDVPLDEAVITQHQASREMRHRQNEVFKGSRDVRKAITVVSAQEVRLDHSDRWIFSKTTEPWARKQVTGKTMPLAEAFESLSRAEYEAFSAHVNGPRRILDLGCGLGRVAVFLNRMLDDPAVEYVLADSTAPPTVKPTYRWETSEFYNDLAATAEFCAANGLANFRTFDVRRDDWSTLVGWPDLIVSMLGIGFHASLDDELPRLHALAHAKTTLIFGLPGSGDIQKWDARPDFTDRFETQTIIPFHSAYHTHEGRVLILKGKHT